MATKNRYKEVVNLATVHISQASLETWITKPPHKNVAKVIKIHWFIFDKCSILPELIFTTYPSPLALT